MLSMGRLEIGRAEHWRADYDSASTRKAVQQQGKVHHHFDNTKYSLMKLLEVNFTETKHGFISSEQ